jgi:hypothetical protein
MKKLAACLMLISFASPSYALPFTIKPLAGTTLPTTLSGNSATAFYTITNNTALEKHNIFVKYLPLNVTQGNDGAQPNLCGIRFNLASGSSCNLELNITGEVDANDADPHHHLFVCLSDGMTCAGTSYPLSVTKSPSAQQFTVTAIVGANGTLLPSNAQTVSSGSSVNFTASPDNGFLINEWLMDGSLVQSGGPTFTLKNINANHTIAVSFVATPLLAVAGFYSNNPVPTITNLPLLGLSSDGGLTWAYAIQSGTALPTDYRPVSYGAPLVATSCSGTGNTGFCVAVGQYYNSNSSPYPLIALAKQKGTEISYPVYSASSLLPSDYTSSGGFTSVSCGSSHCVAGGTYTAGSTVFPMIAVSTNSGVTWTYPIQSANMPAQYASSGTLQAGKCSQNSPICTAHGSYTATDSKTYPVVALSSNAGSAWTYPLQSTGPLPSDYLNNGSFTTSACHGTTCIAAGSYDNTAGTKPFIATSHDSGASWSYTLSSTSMTLPTSLKDLSYFNWADSSCSSTTCIVVGSYYSSNYQVYPLLAVSQDSGTTWSFPISGEGLLPQDYNTNGGFNSASCSNAICAAAGSYQNTEGYYPMIATSTDHGVTFAYTMQIGSSTQPGNASSTSMLRSIDCTGALCIAGGNTQYMAKMYPLALVSQNGGIDWTYSFDSASSMLPVGYVTNGNFYGAASG